MITIQKDKNKDFIILNLTDFQLTKNEWQIEHKNGAITNYTLDELYKRVKPDLVTVSGDLAWCCDLEALECLANKLDSFGVPYCVVWGNHDQDGGMDKLEKSVELFKKHPLFTYEEGPKELGNGNYLVTINEGDKVVEGLIMMDSHDKAPNSFRDGKEHWEWAKLYDEQIPWYKEQIEALKSLGCKDASLIMHIPIYAYRHAFNAAWNKEYESGKIALSDTYKSEYWNEGYKDSFGTCWEGICSYPQDEFVFDTIKECGLTKTLIAGHDHTNCFHIVYEGVRFVYGVKTGPGCYWKNPVNGGTVIKIGSEGVTQVYHEFIDISHML